MLEEDLTVEAQAFVAKETGKCRVMVGKKVGGGGIRKQVMKYVADSAATCSKLCRQYGCHPKANDRVVDNVCAVFAVGQAKALTTPTCITTFHCTYGHTRGTAQENGGAVRSQPQRGTPRGPGVFDVEGATEAHHRVDVSQSRCPPTPPQQLPTNAEEGESTGMEGASGEGASNQGGGRMEELDSESNLDNITEVWPPVPPATREAPVAESGAGAAGVRKATPQHHWSPPGGPISVAPTEAIAAEAATTAVAAITAITAVTATTAGTFPRPRGDLRTIWRSSASSLHCKADERGPSRGA